MWRMSKLFLVHGVVGSVESGNVKDMGAGMGKRSTVYAPDDRANCRIRANRQSFMRS